MKLVVVSMAAPSMYCSQALHTLLVDEGGRLYGMGSNKCNATGVDESQESVDSPTCAVGEGSALAVQHTADASCARPRADPFF